MPELYLITSPEEDAAARQWGYPLAHMAYGTGDEILELTVGRLSLTTQGGWLVLTDQHLPEVGDPRQFATQVKLECRRRHYQAVLADFELPANDRACEIISALSAANLSLILPASYGEIFPKALVLVESAISGGNLREYFEEQTARWPERICLSLRPLRMRFPMPSQNPEGENLDSKTLAAILQCHQSYFSHELGCRYCTQQLDSQFFFVLFDDTDSLRYKLELADQLGIHTAAVLYQEVLPMLPL